MMLYFSVPLILVQILLCLLCYPQVIRNYREKTDYSMEQSVNQAISFTKSYLQNMTYLADMVEDSGVIQGILSAIHMSFPIPFIVSACMCRMKLCIRKIIITFMECRV